MPKFKKEVLTGKCQDLSLFSVFGLILFFNFQKSEFGGFEKQEIKFFWPKLQIKLYSTYFYTWLILLIDNVVSNF